MFGSTKLNASRNPFILNLTVENVLLARDAGSVTQLLCSLMNYFVSDLGPSPAQLGVAAAADDDAIFFFWPHQDMMPYSAPVLKHCESTFPQSC